jgi:hypothetical protein
MAAFLPEFLLSLVRFEAVARAATNEESCLRKGSSEQVLRQTQDERQVVDFVRGELVEPHSKPTCSGFPKDEAERMLQWVERAKKVEPSGQVMIAGAVQRDELLLESGDVCRIPVQDGLVLVSDEAVLPKCQRIRSQARPAGLHQAGRWLFAKREYLTHHHRPPRWWLR